MLWKLVLCIIITFYVSNELTSYRTNLIISYSCCKIYWKKVLEFGKGVYFVQFSISADSSFISADSPFQKFRICNCTFNNKICQCHFCMWLLPTCTKKFMCQHSENLTCLINQFVGTVSSHLLSIYWSFRLHIIMLRLLSSSRYHMAAQVILRWVH